MEKDLIKKANRIIIIGGSGSGKTVLSENLAKDLDLPVCHLDGIHHLANWEVRDKEERDTIIFEKINEPKWVMDGTYSSTLKERLAKSDLAIFLDYSSLSQIKGVLSRFIKLKGKERPEMPGCNEKMSFSFLLWVFNWRKNKRVGVIEALNTIDKEKVLIFKSRKSLNKWYKTTFKKNMVI